MAIVGIIPARFGSTRLPGKPPSDIHGETIILDDFQGDEPLLDPAGIGAAARGLERLRALSHGLRVGVMEGESDMAVDVPEDLERVRALLSPEKGRVA